MMQSVELYVEIDNMWNCMDTYIQPQCGVRRNVNAPLLRGSFRVLIPILSSYVNKNVKL